MAIKLAQATHDLMDLMHLWTDGRVSIIDVNVPIEVRGENLSGAIRNDWKITVSIGDKQNFHAKSWEAILGLYVWSIKRANDDLGEVPQDLFFRVFQMKDKNAHQTRLLLQKWSNNAKIIDRNHEPVNALRDCQTFGHLDIQSSSQPGNYGVPVAVPSSLDMLAAQDIYMYILFSVLTDLPNIGGKTCVSGSDKNHFRVHNDRVDKLATAFQNSGLGYFSEGLLCILPVLYNRKLLPEISIDSLEVRQQLEDFVGKQDYYRAFIMSEWLCCVDDHGNVESSLIEYGFLCLRGLMNPDFGMRLSIERILAIVNSTHDGHSLTFESTYLSRIASIPSLEWWENFRNEMHCMATCTSQHLAKHNPPERTMQPLGEMERQLRLASPTNRIYHNLAAAECHTAFLDLWFGLDGWVTSNVDFSYHGVLDWLIQHSFKNILEWLIMRFINEVSSSFSEEVIAEMMTYAASKQYTEVIQMLSRHSEKEHVRDEIVLILASQGDVQTLEMLFDSWNGDTLMKAREKALLRAAEKKQRSVIEINLQRGVDVDACGEDGETALLKVAAQGDINSVTLLLAGGAALEKRGPDQNTALIVAATRGHGAVVELLVEKGADINTIGNRGRTALIAAVRIRSLPTLQYLLSRKADIHIQDYDQSTALDEAIYEGWEGPWLEGRALLESAGAIHKRNR
jgi:ankyrin repeat protein